jgi:hypothetical protein
MYQTEAVFWRSSNRNCEAQILNVTRQCNGEDAVYSSTQQKHIIHCTAVHTDELNCTGQFMRMHRIIMNKTYNRWGKKW